MPQLSVVIIAFNEEKHIEQCLMSVVDVADEIVVVDSFSTDSTLEICKKYNAKIIHQKFLGYKDQKNFALDHATYDYILSLDADEALSEELKNEIIKVKKNWEFDGYILKRLNNYCGRWIYHTSLYPERKIRLFDRRKGGWGGNNIHEVIQMGKEAKVKLLKGHLLHWLYDTYEEHLSKINQYTTISAQEYFRNGVKPNIRRLVINPFWRFIHSYFIKTGFVEGKEGFVISQMLAFSCFLKYAKLRRLYKLSKNKPLGKQPHFVIPTHNGFNSKSNNQFLRVGFDAKRAFFNHSGLGNYSRNLINALTKYQPKVIYTLFSPKTESRIMLQREEQINIVSPKGFGRKFWGSIWRTKFMVKNVKRENIDIYHGLSHELPYGIEKSGAKTVVTVHDLIFIRFPHFFKPLDAIIYKKKLIHACRVADKIVAISHQTKSDLMEFLKIDSNRIEVIYQGCNAVFWENYTPSQVEFIRAKYELPNKYLLYVGTIEERKNLLSGIKAVHETGIDIPLVAVGRKSEYFYNVVLPYVKENNVCNVIFLEGVVNEDLPIIYQNAECFIYPSLFEGFGIPLLEALVSGIPVITSAGGCFSEAAGPGSIYVNPTSHLEIAAAIRKVCDNLDLRKQMIAQGKEYAKRFSQEAIADNYMNLYKSLFNNK
jgi:glycosyltransferase involved in cell wall biosynthesis